MNSSIRGLRNLLEDIEESFDETRTYGPGDHNIMDLITEVHETLKQLDLPIQSYHHAKNKDVDEGTVADFKTALDVLERELSAAFHEIQPDYRLQLDTRLGAGPNDRRRSPLTRRSSTSASAAESNHDRSSHTSSTSLLPPYSPGIGSSHNMSTIQSETIPGSPTTEEKEVYQRSASENAATELGMPLSSDWRSPFATPDPMSISIEEASQMILQSDRNLAADFARPRSSTGPLLSGNLSGSSHLPDRELNSTTDDQRLAKVRSEPLQLISMDVEPREYAIRPKDLGRRHTMLRADGATPLSIDVAKGDMSVGLVTRASDIAHLSPKDAVQDSGHRSRSNSGTSIVFATRSVETGERTESTASELAPISAPITSRSGNTGAFTDTTPEPKGLNIIYGSESEASMLEAQRNEHPQTASGELGHERNLLQNERDPVLPLIAQEATIAPSPDRPPPPPPPLQVTETNSVAPTSPQKINAPPVPRRLPPKPPTPRRKPKIPKSPSAYRVVNATRSESTSSDEELYTTSKPSSPIAISHTTLNQAATSDIAHNGADAGEMHDDLHAQQTDGKQSKARESYRQNFYNARVEYTPSETPEVSSPGSASVPSPTSFHGSLNSHKPSQESLSQIAPRHSTSTISSRDSHVSLKQSSSISQMQPPIVERPKYSRYRSRMQIRSERPIQDAFHVDSANEIKPRASIYSEKETVSIDDSKTADPASARTDDSRHNEDVANEARSPSVLSENSAYAFPKIDRSSSATSPPVTAVDQAAEEQMDSGWYAPGVDTTESAELDEERVYQ